MIPKEKHPEPWRFHPKVALIIALLGVVLTVPFATMIYSFREYKKDSDVVSLTEKITHHQPLHPPVEIPVSTGRPPDTSVQKYP